ncbi:MAG: ribosome hibernation-promoting factor, HPF/YfiA family [Elusimicrobiota bacterium]
MKVLIHGHETDVQPRWRDHIYERLAKLDRFEEKIVKLEFILTSSHHHLKGAESCHIIAKVPRKTISIKKEAQVMIEAIDVAAKVLEQKIHSLFKDIKTRHRRSKEIRMVKRGMVTYMTGN